MFPARAPRICIACTRIPDEASSYAPVPRSCLVHGLPGDGWHGRPEEGRSRGQVLWPGKLQYRYYLVYAQNKQSGREWKGDIPVCVGREAFTLKSTVCRSDQYQRLFQQVDTGNSENWTYNLRP